MKEKLRFMKATITSSKSHLIKISEGKNTQNRKENFSEKMMEKLSRLMTLESTDPENINPSI